VQLRFDHLFTICDLHMAATDDLPWPELGNVSRGATRGNQGQKGVLGPADREGRCILQLRVQPGVLAVRLNRQASDWYRTLDGEVNRALKLTKTYWRKARRRQDYDARADQDHMELHEWLQQLKDKTMSQLELLMQKGDIQGPPYAMPDDIELSFLRKFIERQATGIPHNPRLRNSLGENSFALRGNSVGSITPEPSDHGFADQKPRRAPAGEYDFCDYTSLITESWLDNVSDGSSSHIVQSSRTSGSPTLHNPDTLAQEASSSSMLLFSSLSFKSHSTIRTRTTSCPCLTFPSTKRHSRCLFEVQYMPRYRAASETGRLDSRKASR